MRSSQKWKILWITDPWATLDHPRDTTLRLMEEGCHQPKLNLKQYWSDSRSIRLADGKVLLDAQEILEIDSHRNADALKGAARKAFSPQEFDLVVYRPDPPVDFAYLHPLQLLSLALDGSRQTEVVNPFKVLFERNEKFEGASLRGMTPAARVSSQWTELKSFGVQQGKTVLKPLYEAGSRGIELLEWKTAEGIEKSRQVLMHATQNFNTPVLLQIYLEGIVDGETRLWFVDGKLLAQAKKLPIQNDFRVDMDRGSRVAPVSLTSKEKKAAHQVAQILKKKAIRLAAVDLIEGYVTDFNFTSPGLICQMETVLGQNLAYPILRSLRGLRRSR